MVALRNHLSPEMELDELDEASVNRILDACDKIDAIIEEMALKEATREEHRSAAEGSGPQA